MKINGVECTLHHIGIPTSEPKPGERFSERFRMYTSDSNAGFVRMQWHRFEPDSPLHPLLQTLPHIAFQVDDLDSAIAGQNLLLGPYEPIPGYRVAILEYGAQPIELVQTNLTHEQLWGLAQADNVLYDKSLPPSHPAPGS